MKHIILSILIAITSMLCISQTAGATTSRSEVADDENVSYTLTLTASPRAGGSFNRSVTQTVSPGSTPYLYAYTNTNFTFKHWEDNGEVVSTSEGFYYTMPERDANLIAVYEYTPGNPPDPQLEEKVQTYKVRIQSVPSYAGSFGNSKEWDGVPNEGYDVYAFDNGNFKFKCWKENGEEISTDRYYYFNMPERDMNFVAVYEYLPGNPLNPSVNLFNSETGMLTMDDFATGSLYNQMSNVLYKQGVNWDQVTMVTVYGAINSSDFTAPNNFSNCNVVDFSHTTGLTNTYSYAYNSNTHLRTIILPESLEGIPYGSFRGCTALEEVVMYSTTPPSLGSYTFMDMNTEGVILYVPDESVDAYKAKEEYVTRFINILPISQYEDITFPSIQSLNFELLSTDSWTDITKPQSFRITGTYGSGLGKKGQIMYSVDGQDWIAATDEMDPRTAFDKTISADFSISGYTTHTLRVVAIDEDGQYSKVKQIKFYDINKLDYSSYGTLYYNGNEHKPVITLRNPSYENLTPGTDYLITGYSNNVNAGTATAVLEGVYPYTIGTRNFDFRIYKATLTGTINLDYTECDFDGTYHTPFVSYVDDNFSDLVLDEDYYVIYYYNRYAGQAQVHIYGKGNYTSSMCAYFNINRIDLSLDDLTITYPDKEIPYDESSHGISVGSIDGVGQRTITYVDENGNSSTNWPTNIGEYTVSIKYEQGNGYNAVEFNDIYTFRITYPSIQNLNFELLSTDSWTDISKPQSFRITGTYGRGSSKNGQIMYSVDGQDWVALTDMMNPRTDFDKTISVDFSTSGYITHTLRVVAVDENGEYYKEEQLKFYDISKLSYVVFGQIYYNGSEQRPVITLVNTSYKNMVPGTDYIIKEYLNNVNAGTATAVLEGVYPYTIGTRNFDFRISKATLTGTINLDYTECNFDGTYHTPFVSYVDDNFNDLVLDEDYYVIYYDNKCAGQAQVKIEGKGNFTSSQTVYFTINRSDLKLEDLDITYPEKEIPYDEQSYGISVGSIDGVGQCTITYTDTDGNSSTDWPTNIGEYTVSIKYEQGTGYNAVEFNDVYTFCITFPSIQNLNFELLSTDSWTDISKPQSFRITGTYGRGSSKKGQIMYSVDGQDWVAATEMLNPRTNFDKTISVDFSTSGYITHTLRVVAVDENGEYSKEEQLKFYDISKLGYSSVGTLYYNRNEHRPVITLHNPSYENLVPGTDYIITEYLNNVNAGTATAVLEGAYPYTIGSRNIDFRINKATLTGTINLDYTECDFDGTYHTPFVSYVDDNFDDLVLDEDYYVRYYYNKYAGQAQVQIEGKDNFNSSQTVYFTINRSDLTLEDLDITYPAEEIPYDERSHGISVGSIDGAGQRTITYVDENGNSSTNRPTDIGEYTISIKYEQGYGYNAVEFNDIYTFRITTIDEEEWTALQAIYNDLDGANWTNKWVLSSDKKCAYTLYGVTISNSHITRINLENNGLKGTLPTEAHGLQYLERLDVSNNSLTGDLGLIGDIYPSLTWLDVRECNFADISKALPASIKTVSMHNQTIDKTYELNIAECGETLTDMFPSVGLYDPSSQSFDDDYTLNVNDGDEWGARLSFEDGKVSVQYAYSGYEYHGKSGDVINATDDHYDSFPLSLLFPMGDADFNGEVTATDLQAVINYAFEQSPRNMFNFTAADTYADEFINVQDVVCLVNILIGEEADNNDSADAAEGAGTAVKSRMPSMSAPQEADAYIYISGGKLILSTAQEIAALDIHLNIMNGKVNWHISELGMMESTKADHAVAYSLTGKTIPAGETVLADVSGAVAVGYATLADADAQNVKVAINADATSIYGIAMGANGKKIYNTAGQLNANTKKGVNIITENGTTKKVFINK